MRQHRPRLLFVSSPFEQVDVRDARFRSRRLSSLNMLIEFGEAFDYSAADFRGWCSEAGFTCFDVIHLAGPSSAATGDKLAARLMPLRPPPLLPRDISRKLRYFPNSLSRPKAPISFPKLAQRFGSPAVAETPSPEPLVSR